MQNDHYLGTGGPSYRQHLADLASRAGENPARPNTDPMRDWVPPYARTEVTLADDNDETATDETPATAVFDPFTERWIEVE